LFVGLLKRKKMAKNFEPETKLHNIIGPGTKIKGDIETNSDLRTDGTIIGNIVSKGKVVVGESGNIQGEINCTNCEVLGTIDGKVTVSELLSLKATSKLHGEIKTSKLSIEPGAIFTGTCDMGKKPNLPNATPPNNETKK